MSNPGVISLAEDTIDGNRFVIEDNIGEAIHIHYGNLRLDLTIKDLLTLGQKMESVLQELLPMVDLKKVDPSFLPFLVRCTRDLTSVEQTFIKGEELYSVVHDSYEPQNLKELMQHYEERSVLPENMTYDIVLFNDGNYILSGLDKALMLYHQEPQKMLPVTRYHFVHQKHSYGMEDIQQQLQRYQSCKTIIKNHLQRLPAGTKVAFRGGGIHADKIMSLLPPDLEVVGVIERSVTERYDLHQRKIFPVAEIPNINVDVMIICSFRYRKEMKAELDNFCGEVIDFYDEFNQKGFRFSKPYYMLQMIDRWITIQD